jgi:hypothetical protein
MVDEVGARLHVIRDVDEYLRRTSRTVPVDDVEPSPKAALAVILGSADDLSTPFTDNTVGEAVVGRRRIIEDDKVDTAIDAID